MTFILDPDSEDWQLAGTVAVDSASLAIVDPAFHADVAGTMGDIAHAAERGTGVVLWSGDGDGIYPVEVRFATSKEFGDRRIFEVRVRFEDVG